MAKPLPKWTRQNEEDLKRILNTAEGMGLKHARLAEAANCSSVHFHFWTKRKSRMTPQQIKAMDALLRMPPDLERRKGLGDSAGDEAVRRIITDLAKLAGEVPDGEPDIMRYLARKNAASIFGMALRLMAGARSDMVKARMVEFLADRGFGRAVQAIEDRTPKPPMEDEEFIDLMQRLLDGQDPKVAKAENKEKSRLNAKGKAKKASHADEDESDE